jgi:alkyl hydroperoxide reductase subunit D
MSIETLKEHMPSYAKDIKLNLSNIASSTVLTAQQLWGTMLASAIAARNDTVIASVAADAAAHLSPEAGNAARAAAAVMAMNNVYYRSIHLLSDKEYGAMPARLRMNAIASPGIEKADFELFSLAVSAINGCGMCLDAHAQELNKAGVSREAVQEALRVAAVIHAAACVVDGEAALPEAREAA